MKICFILICFVCLVSCTSTLCFVPTTYVNECRLYGQPEYVIKFDNDSTYTRTYPYIQGFFIKGEWSIDLDTIKLRDKYEIVDDNKEAIKGDRFYKLNLCLKMKKKYLLEINTLKKKKDWCKLYQEHQ